MADKRMFSKKITDSDSFIEMSSSTQNLYFHLNQGADDDGFNNQVQMAMYKAHASIDDLKVLITKNFVIRFESGVIVIRHWRMHNYIQKDRYKPTIYQAEKAMLKEDVDHVYTECVQDEYNLDTQDRLELGKDRLEIGKDNTTLSTPEPEQSPCPFSKIKELYHNICISYPKIRSIEGERKKAVSARWRGCKNIKLFEELFKAAEASSFLKGQNDRNWSADFDWMMKATNFAKILERKYDDRDASNPKQAGVFGTLAAMYEEADNV